MLDMLRARRASFDKPFETINPPGVDESLTSPILRNRKIITALLDVYLDTIHPNFPFFCEREIWVRWRDGTFPSGPSDYMSLVCMCALSAQHVGNGALFTDDIAAAESATLAHDYLHEALRLVPVDFAEPSIDLVRSYGLLALLGVQSGDRAMAHKYLGLYHGVCAQYNLHDESKWPSGIGQCETEVRRRVWWAMYRLEVHTSCVGGSLIRCPEAQTNVGYPSGIHHPPFVPGRDGDYEDWFSGWNATTDLYRVLEHAVSEFRAKRRPRPSILQHGGQDGTGTAMTTTKMVMRRLAKIQDELLPQFEGASSRSSDSGRNRCGFQASNVLCTLHLARMILCISDGAGLVSVFQTARYMMDRMGEIPREYVRAVGSPLLQQLAGVGHMLTAVARKQGRHGVLSLADYAELRAVLVSMVDFLALFNRHYGKIAAAQERLRGEVADLDARVGRMSAQDVSAADDSSPSAGEGTGSSEWLPFLNEAEPDGSTEDVLFLSGDLLSAFTWQDTTPENNA
ncbi:hypothetical protein NKR23_g9284 [Pleurostoma richardsiae]|uniref:Xylanolytic transcriptional activator regulatory domain-containing protein n=1 Tax=Pleurostoma richardsiae TaxID=41990 RepID=A0AA38R685_9PEZI|nr:hypothetical protein NKR23_g9284 [Pleurostoma richardsiae]